MDLEINPIIFTDPGTKATANRKWRRKDEIFMMHNREGSGLNLTDPGVSRESCFQIQRCEREEGGEKMSCERARGNYIFPVFDFYEE